MDVSGDFIKDYSVRVEGHCGDSEFKITPRIKNDVTNEYRLWHNTQQFGIIVPENHLWGPRDYFKSDYYNDTFCHFASEIGYHGFTSPKSIQKFLNNPEKVFEEDGFPTREYAAHATAWGDDERVRFGYYARRIRLAHGQVDVLFSERKENLEDFVRQSQISQAEAKKYFIEKFRIGKVNESVDKVEVISLSAPDNRNMVLFPEKIGGYYTRLERPFPVYGRGGIDRFDIWISQSPDLKFWGNSDLLLGVENVPFANAAAIYKVEPPQMAYLCNFVRKKIVG